MFSLILFILNMSHTNLKNVCKVLFLSALGALAPITFIESGQEQLPSRVAAATFKVDCHAMWEPFAINGAGTSAPLLFT